MNTWHPRAHRVPWTKSGGAHLQVPWRQVLHTTESDTYTPSAASYFGHDLWPHATIGILTTGPDRGEARIWQHGPITLAARAMKNERGGVETNRMRAVQVEIVWRAAEAGDMPDELLDAVRDWVHWVASETGSRLVAPGFHGSEAYGTNAPQRFRPSAWQIFNGVCGHQHVPENSHWDPGVIDIDSILSATPEEIMATSRFVGIVADPTGKPDPKGRMPFWALKADGGVYSFNGAPYLGGPLDDPRHAGKTWIGFVPHPTRRGYIAIPDEASGATCSTFAYAE